MSTKQIELLDEQVVAIVVECLQEDLEMTINAYSTDKQLIDALKTVIMYYMAPSEYEEYIQRLALTEMVRENEKLGLYNDRPSE